MAIVTHRTGGVLFTWDPAKDHANIAKHEGVSFVEAASAYLDPIVLVQKDVHHPDRGRYIGVSVRTRLLLVVFAEATITEDGETLRIISARPAEGNEIRAYRAQFDVKGRLRTRGRGKIERSPVRSRNGRLSFLGFARRHGIPRPGPERHHRITMSLAMHREAQVRGRAIQTASRATSTGARVRKIRVAKNWSQEDLSMASGLPQATISAIEHNRIQIGIRRAQMLADALCVEPGVLLWGMR